MNPIDTPERYAPPEDILSDVLTAMCDETRADCRDRRGSVEGIAERLTDVLTAGDHHRLAFRSSCAS
jgi:hypothetical protein